MVMAQTSSGDVGTLCTSGFVGVVVLYVMALWHVIFIPKQ